MFYIVCTTIFVRRLTISSQRFCLYVTIFDIIVDVAHLRRYFYLMLQREEKMRSPQVLFFTIKTAWQVIEVRVQFIGEVVDGRGGYLIQFKY